MSPRWSDSTRSGKILGPEGTVIAQGDESLTLQGQHEQPLAIGIPVRGLIYTQGGNRPEPVVVPVFGEEVRKPL